METISHDDVWGNFCRCWGRYAFISKLDERETGNGFYLRILFFAAAAAVGTRNEFLFRINFPDTGFCCICTGLYSRDYYIT